MRETSAACAARSGCKACGACRVRQVAGLPQPIAGLAVAHAAPFLAHMGGCIVAMGTWRRSRKQSRAEQTRGYRLWMHERGSIQFSVEKGVLGLDGCFNWKKHGWVQAKGLERVGLSRTGWAEKGLQRNARCDGSRGDGITARPFIQSRGRRTKTASVASRTSPPSGLHTT